MITEDMVLGFVFGILMVVSIIAIVTVKGWMNKCDDEYEDEIFDDETPDCTVYTVYTERYYIPECPAPLKCDFVRNEERKNPYIAGTVRAQAWEEGRR